jgi:hypothetical protein
LRRIGVVCLAGYVMSVLEKNIYSHPYQLESRVERTGIQSGGVPYYHSRRYPLWIRFGKFSAFTFTRC